MTFHNKSKEDMQKIEDEFCTRMDFDQTISFWEWVEQRKRGKEAEV